MLKQLYEIFFTMKTNCSDGLVFKKKCFCLKFDVIRGIHFPTVASKLGKYLSIIPNTYLEILVGSKIPGENRVICCVLGHNYSELSSAAGFIVQLLLLIGRLLTFPLKHFVIFNGSHSFIVTRDKLRRYAIIYYDIM